MSTKPWDARIAAVVVAPFIDSNRIYPNHFTSVRLLVGLAGAACFASGHSANTAALLIVMSNFLDHADGELARMRGKTSRFGHYFDLAADAIVTVAMFAGIGIGLADGSLGAWAVVAGSIAGLAVAIIFHLRYMLENQYGKGATKQLQWAGFEAEDVLYLLPVVTLTDTLDWFLYVAAIGAPAACVIVTVHFVRVMRSPKDGAQ